MEKLCIDVKGFSDEKKKRVQDAFFNLGIGWQYWGKQHKFLNSASYGNVRVSGEAESYLMLRGGDVDMTDAQKPYAITYTQLMQKAGLDESDPDAVDAEWPKLQPGDYTTRKEIISYAKREGLKLKHAYQRLCDAIVNAGADGGNGARYWDVDLKNYGWCNSEGGIKGCCYFHNGEHPFTRHLTPDQILGAADKKRKESISFATQIPISMLFGRNVSREGEVIGSCGPMHRVLANDEADELATHNLRETIEGYLWSLDSIRDPEARQLIKQQLTDLQDLEFKLFNGEDDNA